MEIKRIYEAASEDDGFRILVDRLWPRGLRKEKAKVNLWLKEIAPSNDLRKWFSHDPGKWEEFKERYFEELEDKKDLIDLILKKTEEGKITLLYQAKDEKFNNAIALKEYLLKIKI